MTNRNIPDLLKTPLGARVKGIDEWESVMRPYYKELFINEEYGRLTDMGISVSVNVTETKRNDYCGKATSETVEFTLTRGELSHTVKCDLAIPSTAYSKPAPFFIHIGFSDGLPEPHCPIEEIIDSGFGVFHVHYSAITSDDGNFADGLARFFVDGERGGDTTGKIMIWSYFLGRMMDYLKTRVEANGERIGVIGHSRLGKTALLTAALDERFAFCCSHNSGCSGVAISRAKPDGAEHISNITKNFPFWFCPNYLKYVDNEDSFSTDQHALVSLVAPRPMLVGVAELDDWADNEGQLLSLKSASPAWELYGKKGLICDTASPSVGDIFDGGAVSFFVRGGKHFLGREDWKNYISILKGKLKIG